MCVLFLFCFFSPCVARGADSAAAACAEAGDVNPEEGAEILQSGQELERCPLQQIKYSNL